jgi:hypothetical protein
MASSTNNEALQYEVLSAGYARILSASAPLILWRTKCLHPYNARGKISSLYYDWILKKHPVLTQHQKRSARKMKAYRNQTFTQNFSHRCFRCRLLLSCSFRWFLRTMQETGPNPFNVIFNGYWATTLFLLAQLPSFSKLFIQRTNGLVGRRVLCVLCTKFTLHSNHRLTRVIFQQTKRLLPRDGHFLTTYTRIS